MATRQNSTNGKPKSPRIQVVITESIYEQLTILANNESRTVSNMAKVLIQEGIKKYLKNYPKYILLQLVMLVTTPTKITKRISQFVAIY